MRMYYDTIYRAQVAIELNDIKYYIQYVDKVPYVKHTVDIYSYKYLVNYLMEHPTAVIDTDWAYGGKLLNPISFVSLYDLRINTQQFTVDIGMWSK